MVVGEVSTRTDVVVIGGGPGGYTAALEVAHRGLSATLVERDRVGGTCLNVGCIPSKTLLHVADVAAAAREGEPLGIDAVVSVDMPRVQRHMSRVMDRLRTGVERELEAAGITRLTGTARFTGPRRVAVDRGDAVEHVEFDHAIVATGSSPIELPELPVDGAKIVDSAGALGLDRIPRALAVVGAGYVGVELATAFAKLGSAVTLVDQAPHVLAGTERTLTSVVERSLRKRGVELVLGASALERSGDELLVQCGDVEHRHPADVVVVAVGRRPNTGGIGLERAGVQRTADGRIVVAPSRRAGAGVLAIGDVTAGPALAHKATAEARVAAATAAGERAAFDPLAIPLVVYSDPEVASVGVTRSQAAVDGVDAVDATFPYGASGRAVTLGATGGHCQVVCAREDGRVLGLHVVGPGASDLAGEAALAIELGATAEDLALTVHPHPTMTESLADAATRINFD